jgi:hypothetical protein
MGQNPFETKIRPEWNLGAWVIILRVRDKFKNCQHILLFQILSATKFMDSKKGTNMDFL